MGELISAYIDGKVTRIRRSLKSQIFKLVDHFRAEILEPNPLKEKGIPPCQLLVIFHKYEEEANTVEGEVTGSRELPIMEGILLGSGSYPYFDDEVKRIFKEEEIRITLESVIFHDIVSQLAPKLIKAYYMFEQENYASTKTICRKVIENLRNHTKDWECIDESESVYEKFKKMINSLYSFSSIGGPHEGVVTKDETELILKSTHAFLLYINSIFKNERFKQKTQPE